MICLYLEPSRVRVLPMMAQGLRQVGRYFSECITKVEFSGEHCIFGTGELFLDCVLRDLRQEYSEFDVKVSNPSVAFRETVLGCCDRICGMSSPNGRNQFYFFCEPLEHGVSSAVVSGDVSLGLSSQSLANVLMERFEWDIVSSRRVWSLGPLEQGCNVLLDDTISSEVDETMLSAIRHCVVMGFR